MATWTSAYISELPDSAFACIDGSGRHYPHHDAAGKLDLPHLRAALSRIGDESNTQCGKDHLAAHARAAGVGSGKAMVPMKAQLMDDGELDAWFAGKIPRRLLAIPFGGPLPSPHYAKGADLDGEFFSERTDIKARWLDFRIVDWHHGKDPTGLMGHPDTGPGQAPIEGRVDLGKAILDDEPDEDGWWVDLWLRAGDERHAQIRRLRKLLERGGQLFGSSETIEGVAKKASTGELLVWPYWRQTLSTSPQNTYSVLRPAKAALSDAITDYDPSPAFWADFADELRNLGDDLRSTSGVGEIVAKAGRVLSSVNETDIDEALAALAAADSLVAAAEKLRAVLARHRKENVPT